MIDTYEDVGKSKELFYHWAVRGYKKINRETLKKDVKRVLLTVNHNTQTATLPIDCEGESIIFVGYIENGCKVPLKLNSNLAQSVIEEIPCDDPCPKCNQSISICNDLEVTETEEIVVVNGSTYTKTVIKKLYPDGKYFLETTIPYYNTVTESVEYAITKEFIAEFDLQSCGCLATTEENLATLQNCNSDVYNCYYTSYNINCENNLGGYRVFSETGMIQLDSRFYKDQVYIEYRGFLQKIKGQWAVPEVAFETLVNWTKYKAIQNKKGVNVYDKREALNDFDRERRNMEKEISRIPLSMIILAARKIPKFNLDWSDDCPTKCTSTSNPYVSMITSACIVSTDSSTSGNAKSILQPFQLAVIVGSGDNTPVDGEYTYYNPELVGALNLNQIFVDNQGETTKEGAFTFNSTTGVITRTNPWFDGSVLIASFAKYI